MEAALKRADLREANGALRAPKRHYSAGPDTPIGQLGRLQVAALVSKLVAAIPPAVVYTSPCPEPCKRHHLYASGSAWRWYWIPHLDGIVSEI